MTAGNGSAAGESREPLDVLAEEFLRRVRAGEPVTVQAFAAEHPSHAAGLQELLPALLVLEEAKRERESTASRPGRAGMPRLQRLGDFEIVREVGRGGMGVVFEAMQKSLGRRVALKVLPQASLLSGNQLERFRREAQVAAQLHHTHIVPVFGYGEADGFHYYAMQYIDGRGLDAFVREQRERGPAELRARCRFAARVGAEVAAALQHAHDQGTLHRDVKPANLLLDASEHVWVTDFGLAKALQQDGLTHSGDLLGTLQYMAPEQLEGSYDARSEVYALGATVFELVALAPAFAASTRTELLDRIRAGRSERLERLCPGVPADLATILGLAMAREPEARYASAGAFGRDLQAFLDDRPIAARRQSPRELLWRWCRRNRALAVASAVALLAVLGAAVVGWTAWWTTDEALARAERNGRAAKAARDLAEGNLDLALQAFADVFDSLVGPDPMHALVDDTGDDEDGAVVALRAPVEPGDVALLQRMLQFYDRFAVENADNQGLREQTACAYRRVGGIQARLGELDAAVAAFEKSLQLFADVTDRDVTRDLAAVQQELGEVQVRRGRPADAETAFQRSLRLLEADAADASRSARLLRARAHYLLATNFRPMAGRRGPLPGPGGRRGGERPFRGAGRPDEFPPERPPEGAGPERPAVLERLQQSRAHIAAAAALLQTLLQEQPDDAECLFLQARCLLESARLRRAPAGPVDAEQQAVQILTQLVAQKPNHDAFRFELAEALLPGPLGRGEVGRLKSAVAHATTLLAHQPSHPEYQALAGRSRSALAAALLQDGDFEHAAAEARAAVAIETALVQGRGQNERFVVQLLRSGVVLARVLARTGQAAAIASELQPIVDLLLRLARDEDLTLDPGQLARWFAQVPEGRLRNPRDQVPRELRALLERLRRR